MAIRITRRSKLLLIAAGLTICAPAAPTLAAQPTGEEVIAKFVEVTGGKDAYEKLNTRISTGTFAIPSQNMTGQITLMQKAPDQLQMSGQIAGVTFARGFDGRVAYEVNSAVGARLIEGDERDMVRQQALMNPLGGLSEFYTAIDNLGVEEIDGREAHKVELTMTSGQKLTEWFDTESGLLAKLHMTMDSLAGQLEITMDFNDWRDVDGVKLPFRMNQQIDPLGIEQTIEFTKVEHNVDIPAEKFALPDEVKDLLKESEPPTTAPATQPAEDRK
jgi:hypothetical protein